MIPARHKPARPTSALLALLLLASTPVACAGDTPVVPAGKPAPSASTTSTSTAPPPAPTTGSTTKPPVPTTTSTAPPPFPSASAQPFPPPPPPVAGYGTQPLPAAVEGYSRCVHPGCSDAARACDDYVRSGCSNGAWPYEGSPPNAQTPNPTFRAAVAACAEWTVSQLPEWLERPADGSPSKQEAKEDPKEEDVKRRARLRLVAQCTRNASSCGEMGICFSGRHVLPKRPTNAPPPIPAQPPVIPPAPDPWTLPFTAPEIDPTGSGTAWGSPAEMMAVDSPSCVACAAERCPTMAYLCFAAADVPAHCPAGDCCHAMRRCIRDCGAYAPGTSTTMFDDCVYACAPGRPHAIQELADLQGCADVACQGCETKDAPSLP